MTIPFLWRRKLRLRKIKEIAYGHSYRTFGSQHLNPSVLIQNLQDNPYTRGSQLGVILSPGDIW